MDHYQRPPLPSEETSSLYDTLLQHPGPTFPLFPFDNVPPHNNGNSENCSNSGTVQERRRRREWEGSGHDGDSPPSHRDSRGDVGGHGRPRAGDVNGVVGGAGAPRCRRRKRVKERSSGAWWERCNSPDFPESEFRKAFRMSRATFDMICDELAPVVARADTTFHAAVPVCQRVAVCIWRLATGDTVRAVSQRFGLGVSTCHKLFLDVCDAIQSVLLPKFLHWPSDEGVEEIKTRFESASGIPHIVGAMYTTHVPINTAAPKSDIESYFNTRRTKRTQKASYSTTIQGVVNPDGVFTDVCIGWPGSMSNDRVLQNSALYQRGMGGMLRGQWIVGGIGYPMMDWMLVPYAQQDMTCMQHGFNKKIGEVHRVAKVAFARLKARWRCLQKRSEVKSDDLLAVLGACCVLHNICEMRSEEMDTESLFGLVDEEIVPENSLRSSRSSQVRDDIAHNLFHYGLAGIVTL